MFAGRTWWIVGASDGLGAEIARRLDLEAARLVLSARNAPGLETLAGQLSRARAVPMDVTDPPSVTAGVAAAGPVDGLIYSVGQYDPMTAVDWNAEASVRVAEANFIGALRLLGHVTPEMARRGQGHIALIGSLAGYVGLPGSIGYGASKGALMHLAEDMRADLRSTGVTVQRINPGFIRTRLTRKNSFRMPQIMTPETAAARVTKALKSGRFSTSFPAPFSLFFLLGSLLPTPLLQRFFAANGVHSSKDTV